jgi:hypothetical protein
MFHKLLPLPQMKTVHEKHGKEFRVSFMFKKNKISIPDLYYLLEIGYFNPFFLILSLIIVSTSKSNSLQSMSP